MNKPLTARLREASVSKSVMCTLPVADIMTAREAMTCLKDLTSQIMMGRLTDELGHDFRLNDAFMRSVELLAHIECDGGEG